MKEFINNLKNGFKRIFASSDIHERKIFYWSMVLFVIISLTVGYITAFLLVGLGGIIYELTYSYVPYSHKEILGHSVNLPDYKKFITDLQDFRVGQNHSFEMDNIFLCFDGMIIGIVISIIFRIIF